MIPNDYKYDIFISYRRIWNIEQWVENHSHPLLKNGLETYLKKKPKIFVDWEIEEGSDWPEELVENLRCSRLLVSIWSPPYFSSKWCLAEFHSFLKRQEYLQTQNIISKLIFPIVFNDGKDFPQEAQRIQAKYDLHNYAIPYKQFKKSYDYIPFYKEMEQIAEKLAERIKTAPKWDPKWPIVMPEPDPKKPYKMEGL